jgi:membrane protein YdbS with pleckstrin-like domain
LPNGRSTACAIPGGRYRRALNACQLLKEKTMSLGTILLIVLILILIGALPSWGYSRSWGYWPSGGLGLVVVVVLILLLMGRI